MTLGTTIMPATGAMSRMKLKIELVIERRVDRVGRLNHEERIAIRERAHDIAARARPVLNDE